MPPIQLNDSQLNSLASFILKLNPDNARALENAPYYAVQGALVYQRNGCTGCHVVNGVGASVGPPLNGIAGRHPRNWVEEHFANPQKFSPESEMPAYKFSPTDLDHLTSYLLALPE